MSIKNVVFGIAIIILTISVAVYGINMIFDSPEYEDYCDEYRTTEVIDTSEKCESIEGYWDVESPRLDGTKGYCDKDYYCRQDYDVANEKHSKVVFMIAVPLGILVIVLGALIFGLEAVGAGLMGGGVGIILYGVGEFWEFAEDWLKFLISLIGLVVLIWFVYWYNEKGFKWKKKRKKKNK